MTEKEVRTGSEVRGCGMNNQTAASIFLLISAVFIVITISTGGLIPFILSLWTIVVHVEYEIKAYIDEKESD